MPLVATTAGRRQQIYISTPRAHFVAGWLRWKTTRRKGWHLLVEMIWARVNTARCVCTGTERNDTTWHTVIICIEDSRRVGRSGCESRFTTSSQRGVCTLELKLEPIILNFLAFGMRLFHN